ncbi:glyoxalase/bleomycin resistance protein/dioxygenase superfamily protein [Novosphingobium sp. PhB55]|uniref:VOC family protein n=1 Tax=Novosphingobium sp. PhB55 TaxID=2485106 RepID=UPI00106691FA|nr:VOC family protein [Novosphingobium sp. PhB55]TDW64569.1 glyoxalase/bleomycin resistance protein/dioxygenase superfamily protein [Novosphingobium sp. PhB55]
MAVPIKFSHVLFQTRRYEEMLAWYQNVFEAVVVHGDAVLSFLRYDEEYHRFAFANLEVLQPEPIQGAGKAESGVNHLSYTYASAGDLLDLYARLRDLGITPYWPVHHGVTLSFYYMDPDGNRIELQVDCFDSEGSIAFMKSDVFARNPIGVGVDPEALLQRYRHGASHEELIARPEGAISNIPEAHGVT